MTDRLIRRAQVLELTGLSRTTLWKMEREGRFPRRRQVGRAAVAWSEREVVEWMQGLPLAASHHEPAITRRGDDEAS